MKRKILLCITITAILSLCGCVNIPNTNSTQDTSGCTFVSLYPDYPAYETTEEIENAASNIYVGTVENIAYEIIDMKTGKVDNSLESKSTTRMLYTVYTIAVKNSLKGDNPTRIKICIIGGTAGYKESEQYEKMQKSGLLSEYNGIPVAFERTNLIVGNQYLFCTVRPVEDFDVVINLTQFAYEVNSSEAKLIEKATQAVQ